MFIPERERQLKVPELTFNRRIGLYAHQHFTVDGQPLDAAKYPAYLQSVLPRPEDVARVHDIDKEPDRIEPKKADSLQRRSPSSSPIGAPPASRWSTPWPPS